MGDRLAIGNKGGKGILILEKLQMGKTLEEKLRGQGDTIS